jgi:DNA-binding Lrp family transcriptional regulator
MSGRPRAADKAAVLQVIHDTVTVSPSEIAKSLNVARATVYRRMKEIKQEEIDQALGISTAGDLKPSEMEFDVFKLLPEVKEFYESLRYLKKRTERYTARMVHGLHRICIHTGKHPTALDYNNVKQLMIKIGKGEVPIKISETKKAIRTWFRFSGKSVDKLTEIGVDGITERLGRDRSMLKFTQEQRHKIMQTVEAMTLCDWKNDKGFSLPFGSSPNLRKAILQFPPVAFYTGTRAGKERIGKDGNPVNDRGILSMSWENIKFESDDLVIIRVVDKGKRGGIVWFKKLIGQPAADFKKFHEEIGKPETGRVFPFDYQTILAFFKEVYKAAEIPRNLYAGMPLHIWRHTAAQEFLDVTDWNYGLTAKTLGWDGTQALEKHYGKMSDGAQLRGLRKAMGLPVVKEEREFLF